MTGDCSGLRKYMHIVEESSWCLMVLPHPRFNADVERRTEQTVKQEMERFRRVEAAQIRLEETTRYKSAP